MFLYLKKLIIAFLLGFSMISYSQTVSSFLANSNDGTVNVNNSPTASAFRIFGDFTSNNYNGIADINIPIHTIKSPDKSYQVSMRYHNGMGTNLKVCQVYWVWGGI